MAGHGSFVVFLIVVVGLLQGANANTTYVVGDGLGWTVPPNNSSSYYDQWASNKTFEIGDAIEFNWNGTHTATEVSSKEEYDNCTKLGIILINSGVKITFNENGTHYFLCSIDSHCEQGQKVTIKVGNGIRTPNSAPPSLTTPALISAVLSILFMAMFVFN